MAASKDIRREEVIIEVLEAGDYFESLSRPNKANSSRRESNERKQLQKLFESLKKAKEEGVF